MANSYCKPDVFHIKSDIHKRFVLEMTQDRFQIHMKCKLTGSFLLLCILNEWLPTCLSLCVPFK